jgi:hypothetical protein
MYPTVNLKHKEKLNAAFSLVRLDVKTKLKLHMPTIKVLNN